ncbi:MAG: 2-deoxy-5-keto-D-gluconate 6-phosphate aldolase domain-containing protein [Actinomycetota bacterium]
MLGLGYDGELFILAFDHRGSFVKKFFGIEGTPSAEDTAKIADAKTIIFEGFLSALGKGVDKATSGVLVDEQFGDAVAKKAKEQGLILAMPAEKSGQDEFDFDYGQDFGQHIETYDPTFCKVLVRYNPEGDGTLNARQVEKLKTLSDWLHHENRKFLFELLVPAEQHQLDAVGGEVARFDTELRPHLMRLAIAQLQESGIEADVWKIEGIDAREDCEAIVEQCKMAGRDRVGCVVLGRGADAAAVDTWLKTASGVPGYQGFAIGRSIWLDPLKAFVDGTLARDAAAEQIGANYVRFIQVYKGTAS